MTILAAIGVLAGGVLLLVLGGHLLISSASSIAQRLGMPPILIGLTIIAWGTSAPELALNLTAAARGQFGLVLGNTVGASICNLALILGIGAMIRPLTVHTQIVRRELPLMIGLLGGATLLALGVHPTGAMRSFERWEGAVVLAGFLGIAGWTIRAALAQRWAQRAMAEDVKEIAERRGERALWLDVVMLLGGVALLGAGGNVAAGGATEIALALGLGEQIIGLTIVAIGTTLPELITCIIGVSRKQADLVVGNAIGSCLFNIGVILALGGIIAPSAMPAGSGFAMLVMCGVALVLAPMSRSFQEKISRAEGVALTAIYGAYIGATVWMALAGS